MTNRIRIFGGLFFLLAASFNLVAQNNTFPTTGNVGIGTTAPAHKLEVNGIVRITALQNRYLQVGGYGSTDNFGYISGGGQSNGTGLKFETTNGPSSASGAVRMTILNDGNVGIGTMSPGFKLDVIGTVRAREVKVDMLGADFVFEEDYGLMPLAELEAFIKANKHLPEIETAAEMEAEGVELGALNSKLLQKIEELTLYLLMQDKQIELLKNENKQLKDLDSRIRILENQSN